jgi:spore coat protein U-like protein
MKMTIPGCVFLELAAANAAAASTTGYVLARRRVANRSEILAGTFPLDTYDPVVFNATQSRVSPQVIRVSCATGIFAAAIDAGSNPDRVRPVRNGANVSAPTECRREAAGPRGADPSTGIRLALTRGGNPIVVYGSIPQNQNIRAGDYADDADVITMTVNF